MGHEKNMKKSISIACQEQGFKLSDALGYFQNLGVNVMAFDDMDRLY